MPIQFSKRAEADLVAIGEFIAKDSLTYAAKFTDEILTNVTTQLSSHPQSGRPGRVLSTRELTVHRHYIVAYRVRQGHVFVITIRHTSRLWPKHM